MVKYSDVYWQDVEAVMQQIPNKERMFGKGIFITGATGMICSSVAEILFYLNFRYKADIKIMLAGRSKDNMQKRFSCFTEGKDYFFVPFDAMEQSMPDIHAEYMIHGAGNASPTVYTQQPIETMLANIVGLNSVLQAAVQGGSERVLYISSSEVYGSKEDNEPYRENDFGYVDILNQRASYPSAKRAAETLCIAYGQEFGLNTVIVRPGHIYGPSITAADSRASAQFTRNAAKGEDIIMKSEGTQLRSYCYTLDCASAILTVLLNGVSGNAYNISNAASIVSISEIAQALAEAAGKKVVFGQATENEKRGYNQMQNSSLNAEKLEMLGWSAAFSLEKGSRKTVFFFEE